MKPWLEPRQRRLAKFTQVYKPIDIVCVYIYTSVYALAAFGTQ